MDYDDATDIDIQRLTLIQRAAMASNFVPLSVFRLDFVLQKTLLKPAVFMADLCQKHHIVGLYGPGHQYDIILRNLDHHSTLEK